MNHRTLIVGSRCWYHTAKSFRTRKARTTIKIDRKARVHVIVDVLAFEFGVGAVGKL